MDDIKLSERLAKYGSDFIVYILEAKQLEARVAELERENEYLRRYGNKDCTAMADEALKGEE